MNGDYNYQPLVIRVILKKKGKASQEEIVEAIGEEYPHFLTVKNPKELFENLEKNSIIKYNKSDQNYVLLDYEDGEEKENKQYQAVLVTRLNQRINADMRLQGPKFKEWMGGQEAGEWIKSHEKHAKTIRDKLISREIIEKWKEDDFVAIFKELYANNNFTNKEYIPKEIISDNGLEAVREEIAEVVYGDKPLSERYDECIKNLKGMKEARLTELLYCYDPTKYVLWNGKAEQYIRNLRLREIVDQGKTDGEKYQKIIDEYIKIIKTLEPFGAKNFFDVDNFLWHHFPDKGEVGEEEEEGRENYWVCAVGRKKVRKDRWNEIKDSSYWGIGWEKIDDLNKYKTEDEIKEAFKKAGYTEKAQAAIDVKKIKAGDILFINDGKQGLFGVARATGIYEYHPELIHMLHQVPVVWISQEYVEWER